MLIKTLRNHQSVLYLMPGQVHITTGPTVIWTVLGSCVSVTMYHKKTGTAMICHAQLPWPRNNARCWEKCPEQCLMNSAEENQYKYVTCSVNHMATEMKKRGIPAHEVMVGLYGGATVTVTQNRISIADANIDAARNALREEHLAIHESDTGGTLGRNLLFESSTGIIMVENHKKNLSANKKITR